MRVFGWISFFLGLAIVFFGFLMDTTVSTGSGRVHNIGLLRAQDNAIMLGGIVLIGGLLMALLGRKSTETTSNNASNELLTAHSKTDGPFVLWDRPDREINDGDYQLYLVNKYKVEKNSTLDKYVVGRAIFDSLSTALNHCDAIDSADSKNKELQEIQKKEAEQSRRIASSVVHEQGEMNAPGWIYTVYQDGSVKILDSQSNEFRYASMSAAKREFTWWI